MRAPFEIVDSRGRSRYRIEPLDGDEVRVTVTSGEDLSASQVLEMTPTDMRELVFFFEELAVEWTGWRGAKVWKPPNERTSLEATHDGLGHVTLEARLFPRYYDLEWCVKAALQLEAGQLDAVAGLAKSAVTDS